MADARTAHRSSFRGSRTSSRPPSPPSVSYPAPPRRIAASTQAEALTQPPSAGSGFSSYFGAWDSLPQGLQQNVKQLYDAGGFEGVSKLAGWYDLPENVRRQILEGVRG